MSKKNKKRSNTPIFFVSAAKKWLEFTKLHVKRSTYENYVYLLNKHIFPYFKEINMRRITCSVINDFMIEKLTNGRLKRKGGISKKYLQDILSIVKSVVNFCEQEYGIPNKIHNIRGLKAEKPEMKILEQPEQKKLSSALVKEENSFNIGILLALYTGMRIGEICGLKWGDFNEKEGIITVKRTVQRIYDNNGGTVLLVGIPKTQASLRTIPLPGFICRILSKHKDSPEKTILSGNEDYLEPSKLRNYFKCLLKKYNIAEIRFHDLRHTFASNCVQLNFDTKTLSEILGHTNVSMTLNRYVHSSLQIKRKYMELVNIA